MPHQVSRRQRVASLVADRLESVSQPIESAPRTMHLGGDGCLAEMNDDPVSASAVRPHGYPSPTSAGEEHEVRELGFRVAFRMKPWPIAQHASQPP